MERASAFRSRVVAAICLSLLSISVRSQDLPLIRDGHYGQLDGFRKWAISLKSVEWWQTLRFSLELEANGLRIYNLENGIIDGDKERYTTDMHMPAARVSDSAIQFVLPIARLPRPRIGSSVPGHGQFVRLELVVRDGAASVHAIPPDARGLRILDSHGIHGLRMTMRHSSMNYRNVEQLPAEGESNVATHVGDLTR